MDRASFERTLNSALKSWKWEIESGSIARMWTHFEAVIEANRRLNLTRITDPKRAAVLHYADSLSLLTWCRDRGIEARRVLDVGTGAGFPAVPLAVARPDWRVTALESTRKKAEFLRRWAAESGLTNLTVESNHSAHWTAPRRFDLIVFRALARLDRALADTARHVSRGGWLSAYKTATLPNAERDAAGAAATRLGLRFAEPFLYDLQIEGETFHRALYPMQRTGTSREKRTQASKT
jgi:16S rRNA (guanine527-N7)-methyltransferase